MNRLRPHMAVFVLGHLLLGSLVVGELVPHSVENEIGLFKADQLKQVHVIVKAHVDVLAS